jgi:phosphatidylglycerophosphate synthase
MLTVAEVKARTAKERDSWWTVLLVDPLALRLTRLVAPLRRLTPNRISLIAFAFGMLAAVCFAQADRGWLIAGAALYYISFLWDCVDGKIARLNTTGTIFGVWLDFILDQVRIIICVSALFGAQYLATRNVAYLVLGAGVLTVELFHYVNSQEIFLINTQMRTRLDAARRRAGVVVEENPAEARKRPGDRSMLDLTGGAGGAGGRLFGRLRSALRRSRIRARLVGGIEFQMAVLVIAPLTGWIIPVTVVAGALMIVFELAVIYMVYRATRSVSDEIANLQP